MPEFICFREKRLKHLRLNFNQHAEFSDILKTLNEITFNGFSIGSNHIIYAVLELINNSLRAHRENEIDHPILTQFVVENKMLRIMVEDAGRGFDPARLPYHLDDPSDKIDLKDERFQEYSKSHGHKRFGMGILLAKKTFSDFRLSFYNAEGDTVPWENNRVHGTRIELALGGTIV
jgi:anti-sigma regulatory factor (Ser/Thr protein kinase)